MCRSLFPNLGPRIINVNERSILMMNCGQPQKCLRHDIEGEHPSISLSLKQGQRGHSWARLGGGVHRAHSGEDMAAEAAAGVCAPWLWLGVTYQVCQALPLPPCLHNQTWSPLDYVYPLEHQQASQEAKTFATRPRPAAATPPHPGLP